MGQYDAVIEIGANVGVFTLYFGSKMKPKGGRVFAFEPSQKAFTRLVQNLSENQLADVCCLNVAVGDKTEFATFHEPEGHLTNGSLISDFAGNFNQNIKATQVLVLNAADLAGLVSPEKRVLLKIDAEGYEAPLIRALSPFVQRIQPDIMLEVLPEFEAEIDASVRDAAVGYQRFAITAQGLQHQSSLHAIGGRDCFLTPGHRATIQ
jgi:FkbM family methyltransferase